MKYTPPCKSMQPFLKTHLGKSALAPLTGQDFRALQAFAHLVDLYGCSDECGRHCAIVAMRACLEAVQTKVWPLFQKAIPHGLDWSDEVTLWAKIAQIDDRGIFGVMDSAVVTKAGPIV